MFDVARVDRVDDTGDRLAQGVARETLVFGTAAILCRGGLQVEGRADVQGAYTHRRSVRTSTRQILPLRGIPSRSPSPRPFCLPKFRVQRRPCVGGPGKTSSTLRASTNLRGGDWRESDLRRVEEGPLRAEENETWNLSVRTWKAMMRRETGMHLSLFCDAPFVTCVSGFTSADWSTILCYWHPRSEGFRRFRERTVTVCRRGPSAQGEDDRSRTTSSRSRCTVQHTEPSEFPDDTRKWG